MFGAFVLSPFQVLHALWTDGYAQVRVTDGRQNEMKMVALMKEIVPEFKSNYRRFEILDVPS